MAAPRTSFVIWTLVACAAGALCALLRPAADAPALELAVEELVRVRGGQAVLVLAEKDGGRRLPVPLSNAEATQIDAALHGAKALAPGALEALGGRVVGASIDELGEGRGFRGHLSLRGSGGELRVDATAGEALTLAIEAGARIWVDAAILDAVGVARDDLRGKSARNLHRETHPPPVLGI